jgi:hypothetical protein
VINKNMNNGIMGVGEAKHIMSVDRANNILE